MKFITSEEIGAPIEFVFAQVSDFAGFERLILKRGGDVQRRIDQTPSAAGMIWDVAFDLRSKRYEIEMMLVAYEPPGAMRFETVSKSLNGDLVLDLVALSRQRTRLQLSSELKPQTMTARLLVQSLKLVQSNMTRRFELSVADFAKVIEARYMRRPAQARRGSRG